MKQILLVLCAIIMLSCCTFAQTFTFKYTTNEDSLSFIKTGNLYIKFKNNVSSSEKHRLSDLFIEKGIQSESVSDDILKLKTSISHSSVDSLSEILADDIILYSSEELIYPIDSTIQWASNDIFFSTEKWYGNKRIVRFAVNSLYKLLQLEQIQRPRICCFNSEL